MAADSTPSTVPASFTNHSTIFPGNGKTVPCPGDVDAGLSKGQMANLGYIMSGAAPLVKKFKVGATPNFAVAGAPAVVAASADAGVVPVTSGTVGITVGLALDTSTYTTNQATVLASGDAQVSVVVNPDAVVRFRVSGSSTAGTAIATVTNSVASTGGTAVTITSGDPIPNSTTTKLDGTLICISGNNVGLRRRITTVSATVYTVLVPFPYTIAAGDKFLALAYFPGGITATGVAGDNLTFTTTPGTLATEVDNTVASSTAGNRYGHVDLVCDTSDPARAVLETYLLASPTVHLYKNIA
jgi:hypothetical protein